MLNSEFFVVARVVGRSGAFKLWTERLVPLCEVSAKEPLGHTYYWGQDLDGEPDTLWGLEGYSHAVGFFMGHPSSSVFKQEMALVDKDQLLKHEQGLSSRDYDLHHYDQVGGWFKRAECAENDSTASYVVVYHFFAREGSRVEVIRLLSELAEVSRHMEGIQSCGVLRECNDASLATLWLRPSASTQQNLQQFQLSESYSDIIATRLTPGNSYVVKVEVHNSKAFIGHINNRG